MAAEPVVLDTDTLSELPFDQEAAAVAAEIWSAAPRSWRRKLGDILIASVAASRQIPLATRKRRDHQHLTQA